MRRIAAVGFLTIALSALGSGAAVGHVALDAIGVLKQYCAEGEAAPHPERIVMRQLMTTDELATFGGTVFVGVYNGARQPDQTGTMSVRVRIHRPDGSLEKLSRIVAPQQELGDAEVQALFPVAVREGDTVVWRVRFRDFEDMQPDDCFLLIGATMKP
ncbi:MAG: hypothetical protein OES47_04675 [Acidobacteriota bacterium]|nr:hypothetical protein [Acidobacteriota bacterium]